MNENIQNNNGVNNSGIPTGNVTSEQPVLQPVSVPTENTVQPQSQSVVQPQSVPQMVVQPQPTVQPEPVVQSQPVVQPLPNVASDGGQEANSNAAPVIQPLPNITTESNVSVSPIGSVPLDQIKPREEQFSEIHKEGEEEKTVPTTPAIPSNDDGAVVNENLKKVEINYQPPSKGKTIALVLLFIALIAFVIFLPDISTIVSRFTAPPELEENEVITTGRLVCDYNSSTTNLDKNYEYTFSFTDSKLEKTDLTITTRGDASLDEDELNELNASCKQVEEVTKTLTGVSVSCNYSDGKLIERQIYNLQSVDMSKVTSAFAESGGSHPEYAYGEDIGLIERNMNSAGYSCRRQR